MAWPDGWPYTDELVRHCFVRFGSADVFRALGETVRRAYEDYLREDEGSMRCWH